MLSVQCTFIASIINIKVLKSQNFEKLGWSYIYIRSIVDFVNIVLHKSWNSSPRIFGAHPDFQNFDFSSYNSFNILN